MSVDGQPATAHGAGNDRRSWLRRLLPVVVIVLAMAVVFAMGWHRYLTLETLVRHRAVLDGFITAHYALAVAAFIGKAATAQIDPPLAAIVALVALVASPIGAWVSIRTHPALLMRILAAVVIIAALRMAASAAFG